MALSLKDSKSATEGGLSVADVFIWETMILLCAQCEAAHGYDSELAVYALEVLLYGQVLVPDILLREQA